MKDLIISVFLVALPMMAVSPLAAQSGHGGGQGLPPDVATELVAFYNSGAAIRMSGASVITRGNEIRGGVAVLGGPVRVAGRIDGQLTVINGDVILEPGAEITGDLIVAGGDVRGLDEAPIRGTVVIYRAPLRYRLVSDDRITLAPPESESEFAAGREFVFGRTDLTLAARRGYNRVEGLPIVFGPRLESHGPNPVRAEFLAIYRTVSGLDFREGRLGYLIQLEKAFLDGALRAGAALRSEVEPIETMGLADRENSLSSFIWHRDYRDHYERRGWAARLHFAPPSESFDLELEFLDERHGSVPARDPWTLFRSGKSWRLQPIIGEGTLRSLSLGGGVDTRNESTDPTTGWHLRWKIERGLGGTLTVPSPIDSLGSSTDPDPEDPDGSGTPVIRPLVFGGPAELDVDFAVGELDLRRYARLGPGSRLAVRVHARSSLNDRPLPPQRQRVLGGVGSLPGYSSFEFDCGARLAPAEYTDGFFYPYYGCDRVALFQIEYRADLSLGRGWGRKFSRDMDLGDKFGWVVFFDAGRAWVERSAAGGRGTGQDDFAADLGFGIRLGRLGLYWAIPLSGEDRDLNFSLRLGPRL